MENIQIEEKEVDVISTTIPSKEEARQQFDHWTKQLNLKHVFTFDEAWDALLEKRIEAIEKQKALERKKEFRGKIVAFEERLRNVPGSLGSDPFPLIHTFAGGLYIRHLTVPPKTLTVTKIHKQEHVFFLQKGTISILTEEGVKKFTAPHMGITKVGTKRIIWHHDEVIFITVHATKETEVSKAEEQLFAKDFSEIEEIEKTKIETFTNVISKEE